MLAGLLILFNTVQFAAEVANDREFKKLLERRGFNKVGQGLVLASVKYMYMNDKERQKFVTGVLKKRPSWGTRETIESLIANSLGYALSDEEVCKSLIPNAANRQPFREAFELIHPTAPGIEGILKGQST